MNDSSESDHWYEVMRTFLHYEDFVDSDLARRQNHINKLPSKYADRLPNISYDKISALKHASCSNQDFFKDMVEFYVSDPQNSTSLPTKIGRSINFNQQHRNQAVLHSLHREWSHAGAKERDGTFKVLVDELKRRLPINESNSYKYKVLVPGCGLGRLPLEIAASGYNCQGNEYSA